MAAVHTLCRADEIAPGEARMFVVDDTMIGVFNLAGKFFAVDNRCPHEGASLAHGYVEGDTVSCRMHHWRFCIRDGTYLNEDRPACNLRTFAICVVEEMLQLELP